MSLLLHYLSDAIKASKESIEDEMRHLNLKDNDLLISRKDKDRINEKLKELIEIVKEVEENG